MPTTETSTIADQVPSLSSSLSSTPVPSSSSSSTSVPSQPIGGNGAPLPPPQNLDPGVVKVMAAIRQVESQGNYNAIGDNGASMGAYQWNNGGTPIEPGSTPKNWQTAAQQYLGNANAPMTAANQNYVAYHQILAYKNQGLTPNSIDALWNGAHPDPNNPGQYLHNNPQRLALFQTALQRQISNTPTTATTNQNADTLPTYGATFAASPDDNGFVLGLKALGNIPSSLYGLGAGLWNVVSHPIQTAENLGGAAIGGVENLTGENAGNPDQYQQTANALGSTLMQRYGSLAAIKNTFVNDPAGAARDLATLITGGEGLVAKGADLADLAAGTTAADLGEGAQYGSYGATVRAGIQAMNEKTFATLGKAAAPVTYLPSKLLNATLGGGVDAEALAAAQRSEIELPAMAYTQNPLVKFGETVAATGAGQEAFMESRVQPVIDAMNATADKIVTSLGAQTDLNMVGKSVVDGMKELEAQHDAANEALYETLDAQAGDVGAHTDNAIKFLNQTISDHEALGETTNLGYFKNKLAVLSGSKAEPYVDAMTGELVKGGTKYGAPTFTTLKKLRTLLREQLGNFNNPIVTTNKADLIRFKGALSADMRTTLLAQINGEKLAALWDKANIAYGDTMDLVQSGYMRTVKRLAENGQEDKILNALFKPSMSVNDIPRIMEMAGPQGAANLRAAFVKQLLDQARTNPLDATSNFSAGKIDKLLAKYGDAKLSALLPSQQIQQIKDLGTLSDAMKGVMNLEKGTSQGFMTRMALSLKTLGEPAALLAVGVKLLSGDIMGAIQIGGGLLGYEGMSRFLASDLGNRILKWGALHGTEFSKTAQAEGLTSQTFGGTMEGNDNVGNTLGGSPPVPGSSTSMGTPPVGGVSPNAPGGLAKLGTAAKKVGKKALQNPQVFGSLVNLAQQRNFDLQGAQNAGYSPDEIQQFLTSTQ